MKTEQHFSWALILMLLTLNFGGMFVHYKMAAPGLGRLSLAFDVSVWIFCLLVQKVKVVKE